jgi:hypothetical protein
MARKPRDYKAEYARRIERGRKRGHSRARARGHKPPRESIAKRNTASVRERLDAAFEEFRKTKNLNRSAKSAKLSAERFALFIRQNRLARKHKGKWRLLPDKRPRDVDMLEAGLGWVVVRVSGFKPASEIGKHKAAVKAFKNNGDETVLAPFIGKSIVDVDGKRHEFETRPNALLRHFKTGRGSFEQTYKLINQ